MLGLKQPDKKEHHQVYQRKSGRLEKYIIILDQSLSSADPFDINHNSRDGTNIRLIHLQNKTIIPEDIQKNILETKRRRELPYQTFVEERISGGDNLWSKMTKVKVFKWTAAAKPLKTNDAKQNIALAIQESSTMMARLLVILETKRRRELPYQTFVEERISGGDNLWSKMTKVKVFKWTAAAKPLKTNDAKQNIALAIQESSTMMARLLVILETKRRRELPYQTFVEERISGGDNLWSKMTKVKVFKWTAAAKPLKTNDAKQNIALAIQESSTMMARLLVITRSFRDIDPRIVISKHELSTINRLLMTPDGMLHPCSDKSQLIYKLESITCIVPLIRG